MKQFFRMFLVSFGAYIGTLFPIYLSSPDVFPAWANPLAISVGLAAAFILEDDFWHLRPRT